MGKVSCPACPRVFNSDFEFRLHWSHSHRGPVPIINLEPTNIEEPRADEEAPYSLAASREETLLFSEGVNFGV